MTIGYSMGLVTANKSASARSIGVALGRACIEKGVSVQAVADYFGVSRQTVYNWFYGISKPSLQHGRLINNFFQSLSKGSGGN